MKMFVRGSCRFFAWGGVLLGVSALSAWDFKWSRGKDIWYSAVDDSADFDTTGTRQYRYYCDGVDPLAILRFKLIEPKANWVVRNDRDMVVFNEDVVEGEEDGHFFDASFKGFPVFNSAFGKIGGWFCLPKVVQNELLRLGVVCSVTTEGENLKMIACQNLGVSVSVFALPRRRNPVLSCYLPKSREGNFSHVVCQMCGTKVINVASGNVSGFMSFFNGGFDGYDEGGLSRGLPGSYVMQKVGEKDGEGYSIRVDSGRVEVGDPDSSWVDGLGPISSIMPVRRGELEVCTDWSAFCERLNLSEREREAENPFDAGWLWRRDIMQEDGWRGRVDRRKALCETVAINGWDGRSGNLGCFFIRFFGDGYVDVSAVILLCEGAVERVGYLNGISDADAGGGGDAGGETVKEEGEKEEGQTAELPEIERSIREFWNGVLEGVLGGGVDVLRSCGIVVGDRSLADSLSGILLMGSEGGGSLSAEEMALGGVLVLPGVAGGSESSSDGGVVLSVVGKEEEEVGEKDLIVPVVVPAEEEEEEEGAAEVPEGNEGSSDDGELVPVEVPVEEEEEEEAAEVLRP